MKRRQFLSGIMGLAGVCASQAKAQQPIQQPSLLEAHIAGYQYYQGEVIQHRIQPGDKLILRPEPENPYDNLAVEIYWKQHKLGYIPRRYNGVIFQLLERKHPLSARIVELNLQQPIWERLKFEIAHL